MNPMDPRDHRATTCNRCGAPAVKPVTRVQVVRPQKIGTATGQGRVTGRGTGIERVLWRCPSCDTDNQRDVTF